MIQSRSTERMTMIGERYTHYIMYQQYTHTHTPRTSCGSLEGHESTVWAIAFDSTGERLGTTLVLNMYWRWIITVATILCVQHLVVLTRQWKYGDPTSLEMNKVNIILIMSSCRKVVLQVSLLLLVTQCGSVCAHGQDIITGLSMTSTGESYPPVFYLAKIFTVQ